MKKIIISINAMKGCLNSADANEAVAHGIHDTLASATVITTPVSDGGDGLVEIFSEFKGSQMIECDTFDALMRPIKAKYIILPTKDAIIEMSQASGLALLRHDEYDIMKSTTYGTGILMLDAVRRGCRNITIGIGGSATNDGGLGLLQAFGYRFFDKDDKIIDSGCGANMIKVSRIDDSLVSKSIGRCRVTVACDVDSPFYGETGAAHLFARQKGANEVMVDMLDRGLVHLATVFYRTTGKDISYMAGAGAAGGLGGALMAFLNAKLKPGCECVLKRIGYDDIIDNADLIITGEGQIDKQTLRGKVPFSILKHGINSHIPVIAVAGQTLDRPTLLHAGFEDIITITPDDMPLDMAMRPEVAKENLYKTGKLIAKRLLE